MAIFNKYLFSLYCKQSLDKLFLITAIIFLQGRNNVACTLMTSRQYYLFSLDHRSEQKEVVLSGLEPHHWFGIKFKLLEREALLHWIYHAILCNHTEPWKDVYIAPMQFYYTSLNICVPISSYDTSLSFSLPLPLSISICSATLTEDYKVLKGSSVS